MYIDSNFRGKSTTFHEAAPDLRSSEFNDRISSLKITPEEKWEVCEYPNYHGRCLVVSGDQSVGAGIGSNAISSLSLGGT